MNMYMQNVIDRCSVKIDIAPMNDTERYPRGVTILTQVRHELSAATGRVKRFFSCDKNPIGIILPKEKTPKKSKAAENDYVN